MFETQVTVRFEEVDSWGVVWHGRYVSYLELARDALVEQYELGPTDLVRMGFAAPVVDLQLSYKQPAQYRDKLRIRMVAQRPKVAKLTFHYRIERPNASRGSDLLAEARTTQVLLRLQQKDGRAGPRSTADVTISNLVFKFPEEISEPLSRLLGDHARPEGSLWSSP